MSMRGYNFAVATPETGALAKYKEGTKITKLVHVLNQIYEDRSSGFAIYWVEENGRTFAIKGVFPVPVHLNGYYSVTGKVTVRNGEKQLSVSEYNTATPTERAGVINVLRLLPGLDRRAVKLYDLCGPDVIDQIKNDPDGVYKKVTGMGFSRAKIREWRDKLRESEDSEGAMKILLGYNIKPQKAKELLDEFGPKIADDIRDNPYSLIEYVDSMSFQDCDKIALTGGYPLDGVTRISEAGKYLLQSLARNNGDTCASEEQLFEGISRQISCPVGYNEARKILKQAETQGENIVTYDVGGNVFRIDAGDLSEKFAEWQKKTKRDPFCYPLYQCPVDMMRRGVEHMLDSRAVERDTTDYGEVYYRLSDFAVYERKIAWNISAIQNEKPIALNDVEAALNEVLKKRAKKSGKIILEEQQRKAILDICAVNNGIFLLTGPAGSGKTFILGIIIDVLRSISKKNRMRFVPQILAPTGKAAKVAERSTGLPASTIHRFLGRITSGAELDRFATLYVIDEMSMVDEELLSGVLTEISKDSKVIMIGDTAQLPSIGAGSCLRDLIASGVIHHNALDTVKRQAETSGVLVNANRINAGEMIQSEIISEDTGENNAYVYAINDPIEVRRKILAISKRAGLKAFQNEELQVLCPKKRGETGSYAMNLLIQKNINPYRPGKDSEGREYDRIKTPITVKYHNRDGIEVEAPLYFQVGDRVIHIKNDYKMPWYDYDHYGELRQTAKTGIMNGETGTIVRICRVRGAGKKIQRIVVKYEDGYIYYDDEMMEELAHAYAVTIHKSQGSQWPIILCPITRSDYIMLNRQLLYTMVTRAQSSIYIAGDPEAIRMGIDNATPMRRNTLLVEELKGSLS